jgi:hypothetical protein
MSLFTDYFSVVENFGCGKSLRWENEVIDVAKRNNEDCGHFDVESIIVKIRMINENNRLMPRLIIQCPQCENHFDQTSQLILKEYSRFHKRDSDR